MTEAEAASHELGLSCLGSGRLGAVALQHSMETADMARGTLPCGGLTRRQIEGVSLDRLTRPLLGLGRWLGRWTRPPRRHP